MDLFMTSADLRAQGLSHSDIDAMVRNMTLTRVRRGLFAPGEAAATFGPEVLELRAAIRTSRTR